MTSEKAPLTYAQAGVDIDKGNAFVEKIKPFVKLTSRLGADTNIGGFGGLFDLKSLGYKDPLLVAATDGVGTKLKIALETKTFDTIGIDLVAMCANDLVVQGAEPLFFLDYYACGKLDIESASQVVKGISEGCIESGCALIGGETAEMPGLYAQDDFDLAGFCVGIVERNSVLPKTVNMKEGDVLIGLPSSGVHSNGYSLVRKIIENQGLQWSDESPFSNQTLKEAFLAPTLIYVKPCLSLIKNHPESIHALAHITGGGLLENVPRVLPKHLTVQESAYNFPFPPLFQWIQDVSQNTRHEMLKTFNCGFGMVLIVKKENAESVLKSAQTFYPEAQILASLTAS